MELLFLLFSCYIWVGNKLFTTGVIAEAELNMRLNSWTLDTLAGVVGPARVLPT